MEHLWKGLESQEEQAINSLRAWWGEGAGKLEFCVMAEEKRMHNSILDGTLGEGEVSFLLRASVGTAWGWCSGPALQADHRQ